MSAECLARDEIQANPGIPRTYIGDGEVEEMEEVERFFVADVVRGLDFLEY
jgi:hypothetical protein